MTQTKKDNRIGWVDNAKFIAMFFVMMHHFDIMPEWFINLYAPFFLTLFFFASGYVYKRKNFSVFIKNKLLTLLMPWFLYGLAMILFNCLLSRSFGQFLTRFLTMMMQVRNNGDSLWFIACLFISFIPFYFIEKYLSRKKGIILLVILSAVFAAYSIFMPPVFPWEGNALPWHVQLIPSVNLVMLLAVLFKEKWENKFDRFVKVKFVLPLIAFYIAMTVLFGYFFSARYALGDYGNNVFCWLLVMTTGLVAFVGLSKLIKPNKFFGFVGRNTFLYYAFHIVVEKFISRIPARIVWGIHDTNSGFNVLLDFFIEKIFPPQTKWWYSVTDITNICYHTVIVLLTMVVLILPFMFINRYLPFTLGRPLKRKKFPLPEQTDKKQ